MSSFVTFQILLQVMIQQMRSRKAADQAVQPEECKGASNEKPEIDRCFKIMYYTMLFQNFIFLANKIVQLLQILQSFNGTQHATSVLYHANCTNDEGSILVMDTFTWLVDVR